MKLILTIIIFAAVLNLVFFTIYVTKRLRAHSRFKALAKAGKLKLKFTRSFIASLFKISHAPDLVAEIGDKIYLMRYYNGRGGKYQVHFADAEFSVRFKILLIRSLFASGGRLLSGHSNVAESTTTVRRKVIIMPKLSVPEEYQDAEIYGKKIVPIIIFNPAPSSLTYVSDERNTIKLAFTGDEFRGVKIFTGTSCANFLEREERYLRSDLAERNEIRPTMSDD